jgi:hypothetical protein
MRLPRGSHRPQRATVGGSNARQLFLCNAAPHGIVSVGIDLAKHVFPVHGVGESGKRGKRRSTEFLRGAMLYKFAHWRGQERAQPRAEDHFVALPKNACGDHQQADGR